MYQTERMDEILAILKKYHYVTVNYLVKEIKYSPASIRRDLTLLEKQGLVKRSYGGVELKNESSTPFRFRQHSMKLAKNRIAEKAASLIKDNDTVFIDGSSSSQYIGNHIIKKKGITVITNNMLLATYLGENGVKTYCAGGYISELPGILSGEITAATFNSMHADIMFFASSGYSDGIIFSRGEGYLTHQRAMIKNSDKKVYLCGSDKIGKKYNHKLCTLSDVDFFLTDGEISDEEIKAFKNTEFIKI